jgi:beta-galactosidase
MHGTLVGSDGEPEPLLGEVAQTAREFASVENAFRGTRVISEVALLNDYESRWAIDWQKHTAKYDQFAILKSYYHELRKRSQSVDIVSPDVPLEQYRLVVAPNLNLIPKERAEHLVEYVRNGGHLVVGPRSGMKDEYNALLPLRQPGYLAEALGGHVEQFYALEKDLPVDGRWGAGEASVWAEYLKTTAADSEVLLRYGTSNGWLDGQPAALTRHYGKGRITYIGAVLDKKLIASAAEWMLKAANVTPVLGPVPEGVEVSRRISPDKTIFVLINFKAQKEKLTLPSSMKSLLDNRETSQVELSPYGVAVLMRPR